MDEGAMAGCYRARMAPVNLYDLTMPELESLLREHGQPAFRAKQVHRWLYDKGVASVEEMSDLPKALRAILQEATALGGLTLRTEQVSKDGTQKRLYALESGHLIESCLLYTSPSPRDGLLSRMPSSA